MRKTIHQCTTHGNQIKWFSKPFSDQMKNDFEINWRQNLQSIAFNFRIIRTVRIDPTKNIIFLILIMKIQLQLYLTYFV